MNYRTYKKSNPHWIALFIYMVELITQPDQPNVCKKPNEV